MVRDSERLSKMIQGRHGLIILDDKDILIHYVTNPEYYITEGLYHTIKKNNFEILLIDQLEHKEKHSFDIFTCFGTIIVKLCHRTTGAEVSRINVRRTHGEFTVL